MINDLLTLCGFEGTEIKKEMPRFETAFDIVGLGEDDIERGIKRINLFFDTELNGIRKILGVWMKEMVNLVLAKQEDKKFLYASIPAIGVDYLTAAMLNSDEVRIAFPDVFFCGTVGVIFDKLHPILEEGESLYLPPGVGHCSLLQLRAGLYAKELIPKGEIFFSCGTICDEVLKADEMLHEYFGVPVQYVNRCHDKEWDEPTNVEREMKFFGAQLKRCEAKVSEIIGFTLTDDMMKGAREFKRKYSRPMRKTLELIASSDPPPISATAMGLIREINTMCLSKEGTEAGAEAIEILYGELEQRVLKGVGVVPKGSPRVMHGYFPSFSDPIVIHMLEEAGIAVPVVELQLFDGGGFTPSVFPKEVKDRHEIQASAYMQGAIGNTVPTEIRAITEACKRLDLDGLFWFIHHSCRPYLAGCQMIKEEVTKELKLPFMLLEGDGYDSRFNSIERLRNNIETFAEMLRMKQSSATV